MSLRVSVSPIAPIPLVLTKRLASTPFVPIALELMMKAFASMTAATTVIVMVNLMVDLSTPLALKPTTFSQMMMPLVVFVSTTGPVLMTKKTFEATKKRLQGRVLGSLEKMMVFVVMKMIVSTKMYLEAARKRPRRQERGN